MGNAKLGDFPTKTGKAWTKAAPGNMVRKMDYCQKKREYKRRFDEPVSLFVTTFVRFLRGGKAARIGTIVNGSQIFAQPLRPWRLLCGLRFQAKFSAEAPRTLRLRREKDQSASLRALSNLWKSVDLLPGIGGSYFSTATWIYPLATCRPLMHHSSR